MKVEVCYEREDVFGEFQKVTDTAEYTDYEMLDKAIDAAFGCFAVRPESYVLINGLKFSWADHSDFKKNKVSVVVKGKVKKLTRGVAATFAKNFAKTCSSEGGYNEVFE